MNRLLLIIIIFIFFCNNSFTQIERRPKIALVLSGGGAKGIAHIGTLKIIDSLKIPIDLIVGTSMGGIIGGLYAIGYSPDKIEDLVKTTDWTELLSDQPRRILLPHFLKKNTSKFQLEFGIKGFTPVVPGAIIQGQKVSLLFSKLTAEYEKTTNFDSLPIPFRCVAIDLSTCKEVILERGSLSKAMQATMSIPTIFSPVEWGDSLLIDGGVLNNFPVDVAKKLGADIIIGSNVSSKLKSKEELESMFDILEQTINIPGAEREKRHEDLTKILVKPDIRYHTAADFDAIKVLEIYNIGIRAANDKLDKFVELKEFLSSRKDTNSRFHTFDNIKNKITESRKTIIHGISIIGNETLPFEFIYDLLGIKPGDEFNPDVLYQSISEIFGLGYFEKINYEIEPLENNHIRIILKVKEKRLRKFLVGLRYDDEYKLVGIIGVQTTNFIIPGFRTLSELQFAGLTKFKLNIAYPTRTLDFPIYPYFDLNYKNVNTNVFDNYGEKIASYADNSFSIAAGIGLSFNKFWILESEINSEYMNITPNIADRTQLDLLPVWKDNLRKIKISLDFDLLDDPLLPREGTLIQANIERSFTDLGSKINYWRADFSADLYLTLLKKHTARFYGYYCLSSSNLPLYKAFIRGGPESFVGLDYNQLRANRMAILRFDYRYEYKKDIFFKLLANMAFDYELGSLKIPADNGIIWGFGAGIEFTSIFGPLQIIYGRGDKSYLSPGEKRDLVYITAGYKF